MEILVGVINTKTNKHSGMSLKMDDNSNYEDIKKEVDNKVKNFLNGDPGEWDWGTWHAPISYFGRTSGWLKYKAGE